MIVFIFVQNVILYYWTPTSIITIRENLKSDEQHNSPPFPRVLSYDPIVNISITVKYNKKVVGHIRLKMHFSWGCVTKIVKYPSTLKTLFLVQEPVTSLHQLCFKIERTSRLWSDQIWALYIMLINPALKGTSRFQCFKIGWSHLTQSNF